MNLSIGSKEYCNGKAELYALTMTQSESESVNPELGLEQVPTSIQNNPKPSTIVTINSSEETINKLTEIENDMKLMKAKIEETSRAGKVPKLVCI